MACDGPRIFAPTYLQTANSGETTWLIYTSSLPQFYPYSKISKLILKPERWSQPFELHLANKEKKVLQVETMGGKRAPKLDDQMKSYLLSKINEKIKKE